MELNIRFLNIVSFSKILWYMWNKEYEILDFFESYFLENYFVIEWIMFSYFGVIYDLFEIIFFIMVEGKYSYWLVLMSRRVGILKDYRFKWWNRNIEIM